MTPFQRKVIDVVCAIPKGETRSYAAVAEAAGSPRAYRAVASLMAKNHDPAIPCHRVIHSDGTLGDYNRGGILKKRRLLLQEQALTKIHEFK
ncbi:MGMT family protein [Candidatus Kaiserbacteria bacterium]|nr:MGMT family protein [Candidatus Kaiserbacteria bacterium]